MEIRHHHMFACVDPDDNSIFFGCNDFKIYGPHLHSATVMVPMNMEFIHGKNEVVGKRKGKRLSSF